MFWTTKALNFISTSFLDQQLEQLDSDFSNRTWPIVDARLYIVYIFLHYTVVSVEASKGDTELGKHRGPFQRSCEKRSLDSRALKVERTYWVW